MTKSCDKCKYYRKTPIDKMPYCKMYHETLYNLRWNCGFFKKRDYCGYYEENKITAANERVK